MGAETSIQAIAALSKAVEVTSGNLANVFTPGYQARRARMEDGPGGEGVWLSHVDVDSTPGPDISALYGERTGGMGATHMPVVKEGSNVDIAREMVDLIVTQNAFAANTAVVREWDRTLGLVVDLKA